MPRLFILGALLLTTVVPVSATDDACEPVPDVTAPGELNLLQVKKTEQGDQHMENRGHAEKKGHKRVPVGSQVPLDQNGYSTVVATKNSEDMIAFIGRLSADLGMRVVDEAGLRKLVTAHESDFSRQSFDSLVKEIKAAVASQSRPSTNERSKPVATISFGNNAGANAGATAPLTEAGYAQVASLDNSAEMETFIRRVAESKGVALNAPGMLASMASYFSGVRQSMHPDTTKDKGFALLVDELTLNKERLAKSDSAISIAWTASLDESGYRKVAAHNSNPEMETFIRRTAVKHDIPVNMPGALAGMARYFSGDISTQSYNALVQDLKRHRDLLAKTEFEVSGAGAPLTEVGYQLVAQRRNNADMESFIRRVAEKRGIVINLSGGVSGIAPYYSGIVQVRSFHDLVEDLEKNRALLAKSDKDMTAGWTAPLDPKGFESVAMMGRPKEMEIFILRLARSKDITINLPGAVSSMANTYSGPKQAQNFQKLVDDLMKHQEVLPKRDSDIASTVSGYTAPLNEKGYEAVVALGSNTEMQAFIRRVAKKQGIRINLAGGAAGMAKYFSGVEVAQTLAALIDDLHRYEEVLAAGDLAANKSAA